MNDYNVHSDRHLDFENEYPQHVQNGMLRIKDLEVA